jgi:Mn2+/Fe2+ NRAMP family transporter
MSDQEARVARDRQLLLEANQNGPLAMLGVFVRLSGPGWLQSAITLGGGSLAGALFLGILGGTSLIWLQLVAIVMGVIMLSAISYVTLSTGKRPFREINEHINPVLGWGWLIATSMANMIWCMPQFSMSYGALRQNLLGSSRVGDSLSAKLTVSAVMLVAVGAALFVNSRGGLAAKAFDTFLKGLVGMIVLCFLGVVGLLATSGQLEGGEILAGFVPNFSHWNAPTGRITARLATLPAAAQEYWHATLIREQRAVMIGAAATAVGINMTFLMPYTLINRGWDRAFRGLARFDLMTALAIPYILVTSCVVIAAAATFHARADDVFMTTDPAVIRQSPVYAGAANLVAKLLEHERGSEPWRALSPTDQQSDIADRMASMPPAEKQIVASLVRRNEFQLSQALAPLLGEQRANLVFGLGVFGMGFSTIIILMLINGFVFCEALGRPLGGAPFAVGCLAAGLVGALWPIVWDGPAKLWLAILASSFGIMLLPIAYVTFFFMMNHRELMGDAKPTGIRMIVWNVLMAISVLGAIAAALAAIKEKAQDPVAGRIVIYGAITYIVLVVLGFVWRFSKQVGSQYGKVASR